MRLRDTLSALVGRLGLWLLRASGGSASTARTVASTLHPLTTEVRLTLDRPRRLRLTSAEALDYLGRTGISFWTGAGLPGGHFNVGDLELDELLELLAVCARADDPTVTVETLAPHIAGETLVEVVAALMTLTSDFVPDVSGDATEDPLVASALLRLMSASTGRSPRRPSASPRKNTGGSHPA